MTSRPQIETEPPHSGPSAAAPLPDAQRRMWFLHQLQGGSRAYHIPEAYRLHGPLDVPALRWALERLTARHEPLRARFAMVSGEPVQRFDPPGPVPLPVEEAGPASGGAGDPVAEALRQEWERPFDLESGPLLRARLLRLAEHDHVLVVTTHHIASDGWSQGVLRAELRALYAAATAQRPDPLPPLPLRYTDAVRPRDHHAGRGPDLAFWTEQLAGLPDAIALPADRPRRVAEPPLVPLVRSTVDKALADRLRDVGRAGGATSYVTLLAAFGVLLWRHTGQTDLAVGAPVANRNRADVERLVGLFANTVVLRLGVRPQAPFTEVLGDARRTAMGAYRHQDVPFEQVVDALSPDRRADRTPLFQVMLAMTPTPPALRLAGLDVTPVEPTYVRARFDLELHVTESHDGLILYWAYDENLYDRWRVELLAGRWTALLRRVVEDPGHPVADLLPAVDDEAWWSGSGAGAGAGAAAPLAEPTPAGSPSAPGSSEEALIRPLFAEVLGLQEVGLHDSFFALGGHSLMAMRLIAKIYDATGVELAVRDIFEAPTIAMLAAVVGMRA